MSDKNKIIQEDILSKGYGMIPKVVMKDSRLSAEAKAIYAYLCSYCGAGNTAFPSVELICHDLGISRNRFTKHRKQLVDFGYIVINRERLANGFSNNIYQLPKTVTLQNVAIQNVALQNLDIGFVDIGNEATNNNSLKINNLNNNNSKKDNMSSKEESVPYKKIIGYLNEQTGKKFKTTDKWKSLIKARWNEGQRYEDFVKVIDIKTKQWLHDSNMSKYLRPQTLFGNKFDDYLNEHQEPQKRTTNSTVHF